MMLVHSSMVMLTMMVTVMTFICMFSSNQYVIASRMTLHDGTLPSMVSLLSSGIVAHDTKTTISSSTTTLLPPSIVKQLSSAVREDRRALSTSSVTEWNKLRAIGHEYMATMSDSNLISTSRESWSIVHVKFDAAVGDDTDATRLMSTIPMTAYPVCDTSIPFEDQLSWKSSTSTGVSFFSLSEDGMIADEDITQLVRGLPGHVDATSWRVQSIDHHWSRYAACDQHIRDHLVYVHDHNNNNDITLVFHRYIDFFAVTERTTHEWTVVARSGSLPCQHSFCLFACFSHFGLLFGRN
jgi:hypothetical protein